MEQKKWMPGVLIIAAMALILAAATVVISTKIGSGGTSGSKINEEKAIVGVWEETTTQLQMTFTKDDEFQMAGATVATYTINTEAQTIHLVYGEAYGNKEADMAYTFVDENTIQLTDASGLHTYKRIDA